MKIIYSELFAQFPEIIFGFSTKIGLNRTPPLSFNLSLTVGDDEKIVRENREAFFYALGLSTQTVALQKQIHSDIIRVVDRAGLVGESDAMITDREGVGLAISSADCVPIFLYDKENKIIAGVHSGWRGTQKQILKKTLIKLAKEYKSKAENIFAFIGPAISQQNYEVGKDVAEKFDQKYSAIIDSKLCLDVTQVNVDFLKNFGIPENQIEISKLCSYSEKDLLHSFRRDGNNSGRALGVIALRGKNS